MTVITRQEVATYAAMMQRMQDEASGKAEGAVRRWMSLHPDCTPAELRNATIAIVDDVVADYGLAVSSLACDLYDGTMAGRGFPLADPWDGDCSDEIRRAVRYQLRKHLDGDDDAYRTAVNDMTQYYVRRYANETTMANCARDHRQYLHAGLDDDTSPQHGPLHQPLDRYGTPSAGTPEAYQTRYYRRRTRAGALDIGDPAFARVPTGIETCTYCLMLASRGFAYHSRESAGHADHRGCNCMIVPGCKGDAVEGVDEDALYDAWRDLEAFEAYVKKHPDEYSKDEVEARKREIVGSYGDSVMVSTEPASVRKLFATKGGAGSLWNEPRSRMASNL